MHAFNDVALALAEGIWSRMRPALAIVCDSKTVQAQLGFYRDDAHVYAASVQRRIQLVLVWQQPYDRGGRPVCDNPIFMVFNLHLVDHLHILLELIHNFHNW